MNIRAARARDARAIAAVHVTSWRAAYRGIVPDRVLEGLSVDEREARWRDRLGDGASLILVAVEEQRVVGFCATSGAEIGALYVDPATWRRGVGSALLAETLGELRRRGVRAIELWVFRDNQGAVAFYERHGFVLDGAEQRHEWADGAVAVRLVAYVGGAEVTDPPAQRSSEAG
jgi:ribosomal protein S18 acetylase RimI-like enzyme